MDLRFEAIDEQHVTRFFFDPEDVGDRKKVRGEAGSRSGVLQGGELGAEGLRRFLSAHIEDIFSLKAS